MYRSVDEDSSGSGDENVSETSGVSADADIDERLDEAAALSVGRSTLVDQAACTSSSLHSPLWLMSTVLQVRYVSMNPLL
uniref:Uncharacterized protein n=1 Tax=Helianthus annuus TaxID=4232 RepID=A0A251V8X4_HELAN